MNIVDSNSHRRTGRLHISDLCSCPELERLLGVFERRANLFNLLVSVVNAPTLPVVGMIVPECVSEQLWARPGALKWTVLLGYLQCIISCLCSSCESSMV